MPPETDPLALFLGHLAASDDAMIAVWAGALLDSESAGASDRDSAVKESEIAQV